MIGGQIVPQAQAIVASANIVKNILAGLVPSVSGLDAVAQLARDIGGFQFDYIGDERIEAGTEITTHYVEDNRFMQDHKAIKPTIITMRGFVAETVFNRRSIIGSILGLSSALATVQPYIGRYSPGTASKMAAAVTQTDQIVNQLAQISGIGGSLTKLIGAFQLSKVQQAYNKLEALRQSNIPFAVVTPWAVFGDVPDNGHGPMFIESVVMIQPDDTRGWADIQVRLIEMRTAPSLLPLTQDNARGSQQSTTNGVVGAS